MKYYFEWTQDISVGDVTIDLQHKELLNEVNILLGDLVSGKDDVEVNKAVEFLSNYITTHLTYEEKYMEEHHYPDIESHKALHQDFKNHYQAFKQKLGSNEFTKKELFSEVEGYIGNWWIHHIGYEDKKYAIFIENSKK